MQYGLPHPRFNESEYMDRKAGFLTTAGKIISKTFRKTVVKSRHAYKMASVQALQFDDKERCLGAADPRRDGTAEVV